MASVTASATAGRRRKFTVDALFADHRPQAVGVEDLPTAKEIRLDRIVPDPDQPRRSFDEERLAELAASIAIEGVLQPIVVRYDAERDVYVIVHGERRWRASRQAGLATIPAIVRDVPEERRLVQQLMENIVREDLNAVDRAAALRALKAQLGDVPWEQVAEAVGIRRSRLFQLLGTEKLPEAIQEDIRAGRLSEKQSRALHGLPPAHQQALRDLLVHEEIPAAEAMRLARALRAAKVPDEPEAVKRALAELRNRSSAARHAGTDEMATLLSAVAAAATGGRQERVHLSQIAATYGLPPYDATRLQAEVLALARTLARTPAEELRPGTPAYAALAALYGALDAALGTSS